MHMPSIESVKVTKTLIEYIVTSSVVLPPVLHSAAAAALPFAPEIRADFLARSEQLYGEQEQTFQSLADQYSETATRNGLDPQNIILTPRKNPRVNQTPKVRVYNPATGKLE